MRRVAALSICLVLLSAIAMAKKTGDGGDRVQIGNSIDVAQGETVSGDTVCIGCSIHIAGQVQGDAVAIGGRVDVEGKVAGDAVAIGGGVKLGSESSVGGDVTTVGGSVQREAGASVGGDVSVNRHLPVMGGLGTLFLFGLIGTIPVAIVLTMLCFLILGQQRVEVMVTSLRARTGMTMLAGLAVLFGAAVVTFLFPHAGTLKPVVVVAIAIAVCVTMIVGYTAVSLWAGRGVAKGAGPWGALIIGAIVVAVVQAIPFIGAFVFIVLALAAVGIAITTGFGTHSDWLAQRSSQ